MWHIHSSIVFLREEKRNPASEMSLWLLILAFTFQYLTIFTRFLKYCHTPFFPNCSGLIFINFAAQNIGLELGNGMIQQPFSTITSSILEASRHCFGGWRDRCRRKSMQRHELRDMVKNCLLDACKIPVNQHLGEHLLSGEPACSQR